MGRLSGVPSSRLVRVELVKLGLVKLGLAKAVYLESSWNSGWAVARAAKRLRSSSGFEEVSVIVDLRSSVLGGCAEDMGQLVRSSTCGSDRLCIPAC